MDIILPLRAFESTMSTFVQNSLSVAVGSFQREHVDKLMIEKILNLSFWSVWNFWKKQNIGGNSGTLVIVLLTQTSYLLFSQQRLKYYPAVMLLVL